MQGIKNMQAQYLLTKPCQGEDAYTLTVKRRKGIKSKVRSLIRQFLTFDFSLLTL
jgi:hypothetical protein